ncbi:MAG TPA: GNAT family N-acetyltransferase [Casimicrobiaceae bacterium]|jgi:ElaA protein|nr:GNAT family N-acetyltransferase [Casimicrobiaceae bacterium]
MQPQIRWQWARFDDLAPRHLYALLRARIEVFIIEQHCAFLDTDGFDLHAWHLLGWTAPGPGAGDPEVLAAYLRLIESGRVYVEPSIGRVLTVAPFRRVGLGRPLMKEGLRRAAELYPGHAVRIGAQMRLERFYQSLGFHTVSEMYIEDGIEHVQMLRPAESGA